MPDTDAARSRRQSPVAGDPPGAHEDEPPEEVVRAAREAVRQPADPRLERSFGHLAAGSDAATRARAERGAPAEERRPDALLEVIAAWQASADRASQRLEVVTWVLVALTVVVAALTIVLVVRG